MRIEQHEALRVPANWRGQDRAFVIQLERILTDVYRHFNPVSESDLDASLQEKISNILSKTVKKLDSNSDCNDCTESGLYYITSGVVHSPTSWAGMLVIDSGIGRDFYQLVFSRRGVWVRDYSGATPHWEPWRELRWAYIAGDTAIAEDTTMCPGFITNGSAELDFSIPMPKDVPSVSCTLTSLKIIVRGVNGYVDVFDYANRNTERIGASGYTITAKGVNGNLNVIITKSSTLTNATNNTPVTVSVVSAAFTVPS